MLSLTMTVLYAKENPGAWSIVDPGAATLG